MLRTLALFLLVSWSLTAEKRPLTHADYDSWRHIQNQQLSPDGHFLAYAVFPQSGDGEVIIRNLQTGAEYHQPAGELPPPPPPNYANPQIEEAPPTPPGISIKFTPDSTTAVFLAFAQHAEVETAKRAKKKPEEMPKGDLVEITLSSGQAKRTPHVISFQLPSKATGELAYLLQIDAAKLPGKAADDDQDLSKISTPRVTQGELMLREIRSGAERSFPGVTEYTLLKDSSLLVFADESGLSCLHTEQSSAPLRLMSGKAKYEKLSWDESEKRLAFVSDHDDSASKQPLFKLYSWDKHSATPTEMASNQTGGLPAHWIISDKATLSLSRTGRFIFFGTSPASPAQKEPDKVPADEKVSVDLWAWNDDYIQPMQKVRAATERTRSYRAVVDTTSQKVVQLADPAMPEVTPSEDGEYAIGNDDREYRRRQEYDERYEDSYVVSTLTGKRTLFAKEHSGRLAWSPDSRHAIFFDGKDWLLLSAPDGVVKNLTAGLPVTFGRDPYDQPSKPPAEGQALWSKDGNTVFLYDRFDIWRYSLASAAPSNWTRGYGRQHHLAFRIVRFEHDDPADRFLDDKGPVLLRAENEDTRDTGFYSIQPNGTSTKLLMAAKNFAPPIKARDADIYVTAESTFNEFPDLQVTDRTFGHLSRVSDVGKQLATFKWGTAELMHYESADGAKLDGTLYKPADFDPQKKYPMIVYLYERLSQNVNNFVEPRPTNVISPSYYASNGYLILEPDIAYKTGYPGQSALRCVLPAVQEIVNRGYVDEKAIGIQGHSWGGYQIAYMVTQTNRFRAAAPGAPVADMISAYDGIRWGPGLPRQFQYERTQSRIGGTPWEYPLRYIENSPIFMVDRIKTPLLMIHNDADDAVPWYQGIELFLALRRLEKEVYMFSYNGEPHNLRRRPNQKDYTVRLQQFFDYYLKGAEKPAWMEHGIPFIHKGESTSSADSASQY